MKGEGKIFSSREECLNAFENDVIDLQAKVKVRIGSEGESGKEELIETTAGRIIFNEIMPVNLPFINKVLNQSDLKKLEMEVLDKNGFSETSVKFLNDLKDLGFRYATYSGISFSVDDIKIPAEKDEIVADPKTSMTRTPGLFSAGDVDDVPYKQVVIACGEGAKAAISASIYLQKK